MLKRGFLNIVASDCKSFHAYSYIVIHLSYSTNPKDIKIRWIILNVILKHAVCKHNSLVTRALGNTYYKIKCENFSTSYEPHCASGLRFHDLMNMVSLLNIPRLDSWTAMPTTAIDARDTNYIQRTENWTALLIPILSKFKEINTRAYKSSGKLHHSSPMVFIDSDLSGLFEINLSLVWSVTQWNTS